MQIFLNSSLLLQVTTISTTHTFPPPKNAPPTIYLHLTRFYLLSQHTPLFIIVQHEKKYILKKPEKAPLVSYIHIHDITKKSRIHLLRKFDAIKNHAIFIYVPSTVFFIQFEISKKWKTRVHLTGHCTKWQRVCLAVERLFSCSWLKNKE